MKQLWYFSCLCCTNSSHLLNFLGRANFSERQLGFQVTVQSKRSSCAGIPVLSCTFVFTQAGRDDHLATRPHTSQGSLQLGLWHLSVPNLILFFPKRERGNDYSFAHFLKCTQFLATFAEFGLQLTNIPSSFRKWKEKLLLSISVVGWVVTVAGFPLHVCAKLKQYFWNVDKTQF